MDLFLGVFCAVVGGLFGIGGVAVVAAGGYGLVGGMHGGWIYALIMMASGAVMAFVGFFCARYGVRLVQSRGSARQ